MKIKVIAKPNSKIQKVEEIEVNHFRVWVRSPPEGGEANSEIIQLLAEHFGKSQRRFKILEGHKSKMKVVGFTE